MTATTANPENMLRLPQVLKRFPVSRSRFYQGVKEGTFPAPVKVGARTALWRQSDIDKLINSLGK